MWSAPRCACSGATITRSTRATPHRRSPTWPLRRRRVLSRPPMVDVVADPARPGLWKRLVKPYTGEPPPGLYRSTRPDLLIRVAGVAVPHFLSAVMRLGGDQELPELPVAVNRRT